MQDETLALLILNHVPSLTFNGLATLLKQMGSPSEILARFPAWKQNKNWEKDLKEVENKKISLISFLDPSYPSKLKEIFNFPFLLYVQGNLNSEKEIIAIIGTRNASLYGKEMAENFGKTLAEEGAVVASGLARGIDTAAHQGALSKGETVAVLGSGLSHIYPKENQKLAEKIAERGALISEYPMFTPPYRSHFPRRNRIVSGISSGVILVESPLEGGGMLTMNLAEQQGRKLFALPGRIDMETFRGNHVLIKEKKATLIEKPEEALSFFKKKNLLGQHR